MFLNSKSPVMGLRICQVLLLLFPLSSIAASEPKAYYRALGITESATDAEIKKAYREKSRLYHPDKCGRDENGNVDKEQEKECQSINNFKYCHHLFLNLNTTRLG